MIDNDPIGTAGRRRRRQKRFSVENSVCRLCPESHLECLTAVTLDWLEAHQFLIEEHHVAGKRNDPDFVVPLCLNCHRLVTEGLAQAGIGMHREPNPQKRVAVMLEALAVFLDMLAAAVRRWAALLKQTCHVGDSQ
jgi:hypothetical protein